MKQLIETLNNMTTVLIGIDQKLDKISNKVTDVDNNLLGSFDSLRGLGLNNSISDLYQILTTIGYDISRMNGDFIKD